MAEDKTKRKPNGSAEHQRSFSDLPVVTKEGLAFEFEGLARTLAELASNPKNRTPFTVVVRGDWGRWKTTLLLQTKRLLDETLAEAKAKGDRRVRTLWFNAWKYPDEDTVLAGLLGALLDELRRGNLVDQLKTLVADKKDAVAKAIVRHAAPWLKEILK